MRYSKALAAALVAVFMCMTPLFVIDDADAGFDEDKAGYSVSLKNPTDAQLESVAGTSRSMMVQVSLGEYLNEFINTELFGLGTNFTADSFDFDTSSGEKIGSDTDTGIMASKLIVKKFSITIPVVFSGPITVPVTADTPDDEKAAIEAIQAYIGNVAPGDKVVITGDITSEMAMENCVEYGEINETTCVKTKTTGTGYTVIDIDVKCEVIKSGEETGKTIEFNVDVKGSETDTTEFKYDADLKDIVPATTGKKTETIDYDASGSMCVTVDGKDYDIKDNDEPENPETTNIIASGYIVNKASIVIDADLKATIAALPDSSDNMTVGKEYSDAQSAFNDVKDDAVGKKSNTTLFIIIGVVVAVVVIGGIAAFVFLRKKA